MEDLANFARLQSLLTEKDKAELQANLRHAPAWMQAGLMQMLAKGETS